MMTIPELQAKAEHAEAQAQEAVKQGLPAVAELFRHCAVEWLLLIQASQDFYNQTPFQGT